VTLGDHLRSQLSVSIISDEARDAAESIIGNLDEDGYLSASLEEIASIGEHTPEQVEQGLRAVQSLDPAGVGARNLRECLCYRSRASMAWRRAWQIVSNCLRLMETRQYRKSPRCWRVPSSTSRSPSA
jgi:RNA polymerase sigma-54 factor